MGFSEKLNIALKEAQEKGWIEDINDPWTDLDCFGNEDPETNQKNRCNACPLNHLCAEQFQYDPHTKPEYQIPLIFWDDGDGVIL